MVKFNSKNIYELQKEFDLRSTEISIHIVKSVCHALENKLDSVAIGEFNTLDKYAVDIYCNRQEYLDVLKTNLPRCIAAEEYEICAKARDWISRLDKT